VPFAPGGSEGGLDWRRYLAALFRYKWLVMAIVVVGSGLGFAASRVVSPIYEAQANIWVPTAPGEEAPIQPEQLFTNVGWVELIKTSFVVLDDVVRDLRLYVQPAAPVDSAAFTTFGLAGSFRPGDYTLDMTPDGRRFTLRTSAGAIVDEGAVGDSIGDQVGFRWVPPAGSLLPGRGIEFSVVAPRDVAVDLQQRLDARINDRGANFLAVRLQGTDPELLAATLNEVASGFVDTARALASAKHRELLLALSVQLDSAEHKLRNAEVGREQFRVDTYTQPRERASPVTPGLEGTTNPALDNYTEMKFELDGLERDREAIERALSTAGATGLRPDALLYIGAVQQSAELMAVLNDLTTRQSALTALRLRYTEQHPDVQRAAAAVTELQQQAVPRLAGALLEQLRLRERELENRIASAGRELQRIPRRSTEEQRLEREVEITETAYQRLKEQFQDAQFAQSAEDLGARILDPAVVPRWPVRDTARRMLMMAVVGSIGLAVVSALLLDRLDRRVRYPEQVSTDMGLPILGAIPSVKRRSNGRALDAKDALPVVEALRGVRLGLVHAHGVAGPLVVTITSPGPGEGKSFIATNLALAFADAGHRTLLIDGDVRRGELHRALGVSRRPGLTDYLNGQAEPDRVRQRTSYERLAFIGAGTRMHQGPELLSSVLMTQLLLGMRGAYDVILLDSPPLAAGVDPYVLGTASGNLLLVLRPGVTDRELAEAKLDMLDRLPIRVLGAVLNDVRPQGTYRHYGYQYYVEGYETRDEEGKPAPVLTAAAADPQRGE
jgi:tyrosine-protein kinase Etk/Wzc